MRQFGSLFSLQLGVLSSMSIAAIHKAARQAAIDNIVQENEHEQSTITYFDTEVTEPII